MLLLFLLWVSATYKHSLLLLVTWLAQVAQLCLLGWTVPASPIVTDTHSDWHCCVTSVLSLFGNSIWKVYMNQNKIELLETHCHSTCTHDLTISFMLSKCLTCSNITVFEYLGFLNADAGSLKPLIVHSLLPQDLFYLRTEGWCRNQRLQGGNTRDHISEEAQGLKYLWRDLLWLGPHESACGKVLFWISSLFILYICRTKQMLIHRPPDCVRQEY